MAPEQIKNQDLDRRTDVFALGIVLWEMTTNQRLFRMDTDLDTLEKVQACVVPPPSSVVPGYPRHLEEIVLTALARDKEDRYQTARDFSRALQTFLRRHTFVGFEEVGELMKKTFADKLARRNDHLAWASEVTGSVPQEALAAKTVADPDSEVSTLQDEGNTSTNEFPTGVINKVEPAARVAKAGLMEDDDDAATLIARNPSQYLEQLASDRKGRKSDSTQLLPIGGQGDGSAARSVDARAPSTAGRSRRTRSRRCTRRPRGSCRGPSRRLRRRIRRRLGASAFAAAAALASGAAPRAPVPSSTSMNGSLPRSDSSPRAAAADGRPDGGPVAARSGDDALDVGRGRRELLAVVASQPPASDGAADVPEHPSTTSPSSPHALREAPSGSHVTEASVPAAAVGFRPPQNADPSITAPRPMAPTYPDGDSNPVPPTLFDGERSGALASGRLVDPTRAGGLLVPQVPQAAIETQLSAPRTRVRSTLTVVVIILAVLCSITFVLLLAAIGRRIRPVK